MNKLIITAAVIALTGCGTLTPEQIAARQAEKEGCKTKTFGAQVWCPGQRNNINIPPRFVVRTDTSADREVARPRGSN